MSKDNKDRKRGPSCFKQGNVGPDGEYRVGKNRPPEHTRFAAGDGRQRGRRPAGQRNFDTEFAEEAQRKVTLKEGGKERRVSKLRSTIIRAFDNAGSKGQNQAISTVFAQAQKLAEKKAPTGLELGESEEALLAAWIAQYMADKLAGDNLGDPEAPPEEGGAEGTPPDDD